MFVDLPLTELRDYRPEVACPADFDDFWADQLAAARARGSAPVSVPAPSAMRHADVHDLTLTGHGGDPIRAWLLVPHAASPRAPVVVEFVGYNGGRGDPFDWLAFSCAGYPHLVMDSRGQGGGWRGSDTPDPGDNGAPSTNGLLTRGVADPRTYYFTRLFVDAARTVDAAREHPLTAGRPVVTTGASQGGGLAIAATHLSGGAVAATMPDVPFLAHPRRAVQITDAAPYGELVAYCGLYPDRVETVFGTLGYLDAVNHAARAAAPALFSVGLIDEITPASTVFAAYNRYSGPKDITVYPFSGHEGGRTHQILAKLDFLDRRFAGMT